MKFWDRIVIVIVMALMFLAIWDQSVNGRQQVIQSDRRNCQFIEVTRAADAAAWYSAYQARIDQANNTRNLSLSKQYITSAKQYWKSAWQLNYEVEPALSLEVDGKHPLGIGKLNCIKRFPDTNPFEFG